MARIGMFAKKPSKVVFPTEVPPLPPWKVLKCPCGRDTKIYYQGELVPATKWEWSKNLINGQITSFSDDPRQYRYKEHLIIEVYGKQIELLPGEYYFAEYKEVPYGA